MTFLKAEWRKLAMANYEIDPKLLLPYLPAKTELDVWNGINYVSLIGFMFKDTKVLGIKVPFHIDFEEVNLRFYVRHKHNGEWRRGVVFIKEIVPKAAITFVANTLYKEHYQTMKMNHLWEEKQDKRIVQYDWNYNGKLQSFAVEADLESTPIREGSETEFITEHYWGYSKYNDTTTFEYEVTHPKWETYAVKKSKIEVDFGLVYGKEFSILNELEPKSVFLAEGSEITVENKRKC